MFFSFLALLFLFPLTTLAYGKVPDSVFRNEETKGLKKTYEEVSDILLKNGYERYVNGLKVGFIKSDFELNAGKTIHVMPVKNMTDLEAEWIGSFAKNIEDQTVQLLKETELFTAVTTGEKSKTADLRLEIYIRGLVGKDCIWGIDLFDNKTNQKVLSGFDKDSTLGRDVAYGIYIGFSESPRPIDYFMKSLPKKAILFIGRNNPQFNREYLDHFSRKRGPRGYY
jgi:hypothetical protein